MKKVLGSRKFVTGLVAMLTVIANEGFGIGLSEETIQHLVELALITIGGLAVVDTAAVLKGTKQPT